ncbi:MAG: hypothetical protein KBA71_00065 [Opitutaceae bacterium]|nr:hypothetical protein [Opitutaceae bacterium]
MKSSQLWLVRTTDTTFSVVSNVPAQGHSNPTGTIAMAAGECVGEVMRV